MAASEDPPCCRACCKVGSDYQCEKNANSCNGIGVKTDGQGKCGDGNNNVLCAAPKGGDEPSGGGGCACLVTVNGVSECKPAEECMAVFNKFMYIIENHLHWVIVGVVVMAVVCTGVWYVYISSLTVSPCLKKLTTISSFSSSLQLFLRLVLLCEKEACFGKPHARRQFHGGGTCCSSARQ